MDLWVPVQIVLGVILAPLNSEPNFMIGSDGLLFCFVFAF